MHDQFDMGRAVVLAAMSTFAVVVVVAGRKPTTPAWRRAVAWPLGLAAGIYGGCALLDQWPRWPPLEDRDRLLAILLPLSLAVETVVGWQSQRRVLTWLLRAVTAGAAAPILLYKTIYLADLAGPGTAEWSTSEAALILLGLCVLLLAEWAQLDQLQQRIAPRIVTPVLGISCLAAAASVMMSGYYQAGLAGLPLTGALGGATLAAFVVPSSPRGDACLGVGLVSLFSLIALGRFFGALPDGMALCLMLSPLLAWAAAVPATRRLPPAMRAWGAMLLVAVALVCLVAVAHGRFVRAFRQAGGTRSAPVLAPGQVSWLSPLSSY